MPLIRKPTAASSALPVDSAALLHALEHGTDDERWNAARTLPGIPDHTEALGAALLRERNPRVREAIFTGLARIATAQSIERVLPALRSDDAAMRTGALDALRAMQDKIEPYVPQLLADRDADVRLLACELLRNLPGDEASRRLCGLLEVELEPNVCASALEVLAEVGDAEALPVLARCEEKFRGMAFLEFAIKATAEQIRSQTNPARD